ncbi:MAG: hypothetical protein U0075_14560 [Thermomicrobiales bacterium]
MDHSHFDALARLASSSRRMTFATILAATGGLVTLSTVGAKQKKGGQDCGKKARQRCNADAATCRTRILGDCVDDPATCQASAACCDRCSADGLLTCLLDLRNSGVVPRSMA